MKSVKTEKRGEKVILPILGSYIRHQTQLNAWERGQTAQIILNSPQKKVKLHYLKQIDIELQKRLRQSTHRVSGVPLGLFSKQGAFQVL